MMYQDALGDHFLLVEVHFLSEAIAARFEVHPLYSGVLQWLSQMFVLLLLSVETL